MPGTAIDLLAPVHRLTVDEYVRISELGLFDDGPRVELIDGVVVEMSPIADRHRAAVVAFTQVLVPQLAPGHVVSPQSHVRLEALRSVPEPDITVFALDGQGHIDEQPVLVIEVADSSLQYDRTTKSRLYAQRGITEYWIYSVDDATIEVRRDPAAAMWQSHATYAAGTTLRPLVLGDVSVGVDDIAGFVAVNGER